MKAGNAGARTGFAVFLTLVGLLTAGEGVAQVPEPDVGEPSSGLTVHGHAEYDWRIRPLGGTETSLAAFRDEVLFINLWASWCTPCVREMASIEGLRNRVADTDVRFLIVAAEGERTVERFLRRYSYDLPIYLEVRPIPPDFGAVGIPATWIVDRRGRIVLRHYGEAVWDSDEVEAFLRYLDR